MDVVNSTDSSQELNVANMLNEAQNQRIEYPWSNWGSSNEGAESYKLSSRVNHSLDGSEGDTAQQTAVVAASNIGLGVDADPNAPIFSAQMHVGGDPQAPMATLVPAPDEAGFDSDNLDKYLNGDKAHVVFSTAASRNDGFARSVDLKKMESGEKVDDTERQGKVNVEFAKLKHTLGLGDRLPYPKVPISYSATWHFIEVFDGSGESKKYDLLSKSDIKKLLEERGLDASDPKVDEAYRELLKINKELKGHIKEEAGEEKSPLFMHDYVGNPNGLKLFHPFSKADEKIKKDSARAKYGDTMVEFGLATKGEGLFGKPKLNAAGARAFNNMEKASKLQEIILRKLIAKRGEIIQQMERLSRTPGNEPQIAELKKTLKENLDPVIMEVKSANQMAMHLILMELEKEHLPPNGAVRYDAGGQATFDRRKQTGQQLLDPIPVAERGTFLGNQSNDPKAVALKEKQNRHQLAKDVTKDYANMVASHNKQGFVRKKDYELTRKDKQQAAEFGALVEHLQIGGGERLDVIDATQKLQRDVFGETVGQEVFREPKAEKFILNAVLRLSNGEAIEGYPGYGGASSIVRGVLYEALFEYQTTSASIPTHTAGAEIAKNIGSGARTAVNKGADKAQSEGSQMLQFQQARLASLGG
ncbi:MAG: hypothetical protein KDK76_05420 [Chlamydiia bacterium]|nr:hypothetical protein [Chlamydiia bacterium]